MASQHLVITGATGHIGSQLVHALLAQGHRVTAVARPSQRLDALTQAGAQAAAGDLLDGDFLTRTLRGADAAFLMVPPDVKAADVLAHHEEVNVSLAQAVQAAGLRRAVNLSSVLSDQSASNGPAFRRQEERLNGLAGLQVAHLRPAYFMDNLLAQINLIKRMGSAGSATRPGVRLPMVATKDIATKAAELLGADSFENHSAHYLLGPRDYSMQEATAILGQAIGQPELRYVQFSYDQARQGLLQTGMSESMVNLMEGMVRAGNENREVKPSVRTPASTTPTTLEEFAQTMFVPAFQQAN
ncbi:NmrA family NAD(P)-binding protein [Hymenobacter coccineus]|uniref:NmrA-like domain-containing protein n=1 Tax=Hymenobacter coccineus TaxID=1908235 RepID=A0A1G1SU94_9BACT|nr:NAD(P)H-binding protein [Hymenobacter coccineus]OGX82173.1 hypothetical protein BEN49_14510 [Hymenobacter coccineus]